MGPTIVSPLIARRKNRRLWLWALLAGVFVLISVGTLFSFFPVVGLLAVTFAVRVAPKIPEAELEADESPSAMQSLADMRKDVATIQAEMAGEYVRRDIGRLRARVSQLEKVEERIVGVAPQKSERGRRARLHVAAGARILLRAGETAAVIEELVMANPDLQLVIKGQVGGARGKRMKELSKLLARIEDMVGRSNNQLLVAAAVLGDLGYRDPEPEALEPPADDDEEVRAEVAPPPHPTLHHPRRRPQRRQRF